MTDRLKFKWKSVGIIFKPSLMNFKAFPKWPPMSYMNALFFKAYTSFLFSIDVFKEEGVCDLGLSSIESNLFSGSYIFGVILYRISKSFKFSSWSSFPFSETVLAVGFDCSWFKLSWSIIREFLLFLIIKLAIPTPTLLTITFLLLTKSTEPIFFAYWET